MTNLDQIRSALAAIADEAPPAQRVRANLDVAARRQRQRRTLLRVAGAGGLTASAGVAGAGYLARRSPGPPATTDEPDRGWLKVPYRYRPAWLPDGIGQSGHGLLIENDLPVVVSRSWGPAPDVPYAIGPVVRLVVGAHPLTAGGDFDGAEPVDVNGTTGLLKIRAFPTSDSERSAELAWQPPDAPPLSVHLIGAGPRDGEIDPLLRIARSVRRDQRHFWVNPRFGWLPDDIAPVPWTFSVSNQDGVWSEQLESDVFHHRVKTGEPTPRGLRVEIGPAVDGGEMNRAETSPVRVRGLDGLKADDRVLYFTLPDGIKVNLMITPYGSEQPASHLADALRIAEELDFGQWPDMAWVNSR
jgi:hypothetical protein